MAALVAPSSRHLSDLNCMMMIGCDQNDNSNDSASSSSSDSIARQHGNGHELMDVESDGTASSSPAPCPSPAPQRPFASDDDGNSNMMVDDNENDDDDEVEDVPSLLEEEVEGEDSSYVMVEKEARVATDDDDDDEEDTKKQQQQHTTAAEAAGISSDDYWDTPAGSSSSETAGAATAPLPPLLILPPPPPSQLPNANTIVEEDDDDEKPMSVDPLFDDGFDFPFASSATRTTNDVEERQHQKQDAEQQVMVFGGLENMGNTCYMASGLQMLASLDGFTADLRSTSMPVLTTTTSLQKVKTTATSKETQSSSDADNDMDVVVAATREASASDSSPLRDALLDVFNRLGNGETIRPGHFKECFDDRTPLFVGYEQQDAHEFLTTLLDLLDEDYKRVDKNKTSSTPANENGHDGDEQRDEYADDFDDNNNNNKDGHTTGETITTETGLVSDDDDDENKSAVDNEILPGSDDDEEEDTDSDNMNYARGTGSSLIASGTTVSDSVVDDDMFDVVVNNVDMTTTSDQPATPLGDSTVTENETTSSSKKQRLDESEFEIVNGTAAETGGGIDESSRTISLSKMEFVDIETLLYSDVSNTSLALVPHTAIADNNIDDSNKNFASEDKAPKCKLVGGRMDPSTAVLTRYDGGKDVSAASGSGAASSIAASDSDKTKSAVGEKNNDVGCNGNESTESVSDSVRSPVDVNFCTEIRVCLTCDSCKFRRSHTEKYLHLSLEMGDGVSSVEDGLRKFFAPEERELKCEKCFYNKSTVTKEIVRLPRVLLLHLKRFIVDVSPDYTSISYRKDRSEISFEERMSLARVVGEYDDDDDDDDDFYIDNTPSQGCIGGIVEFLAPEVVVEDGSSYAIRSIVNHMGSTATFGHYTADAKRLYPRDVGENRDDEKSSRDRMVDDDDKCDNGEGTTQKQSSSSRREWIRFNDSYVSKISSSDALEHNSSSAYLLLYEMEKNTHIGEVEYNINDNSNGGCTSQVKDSMLYGADDHNDVLSVLV